MFAAYSASKRRDQPSFLELQPIMSNSRNQQYNRRYQPSTSFQDKSKFSATKRQSSARKQNQQNKQNCNRIQLRQQPYESKFTCSPLKQPYVPYDLSKSRHNASYRAKKQYQVEQMQQYSYLKPTQSKQNCRPRNSINNKRPSLGNFQPQKLSNQFDYSSMYDSRQNKSPAFEREAPLTYRGPNRNAQGLNITLQRQNKNTNNSRTPPKLTIQAQKLVEKSQFLRQKIQRINRMTPKGSRINLNPSQSVTPEKQVSVQLFPKQTQENVIVKYNKYCDEKLPLQTIYDAQQHKLQSNWRQVDYQAQAGLLKINRLSQKISQRLSAIISKHSK